MQLQETARVRAAPLAAVASEPAATPRLAPAVRWAATCAATDVAMLAATIAASQAGRAEGIAWTLDGWTIGFCVLTLALFRSRGLYALRLRTSTLDDVARVAVTTTVAATTLVTAHLLVAGAPVALRGLRPWAFAVVYLAGGRALLGALRMGRNPVLVRRVLVLGSGRIATLVATRLLAQPELGLRPVAYLDPTPKPGRRRPRLPLHASEDVEGAIARHRVDHVVVAFSGEGDKELLELVNRAEALGVAASIVPRLFEKVPERAVVEHLGGLPLLTPQPADPSGLEYACKYALDRVVAVLLLVLLAPVLLGTALAVRLTLGRPVLFRQVRVGRDGRRFGLLKFRSMRLPTEDELEAQLRATRAGLPGGVEGSDRRTRLGTFLRKSALDELPQLVNVLRGEMSLVGPRPERPEYVRRFAHTVHRYDDRHRVKSGITGWAQVNGLRGKTSIEDRAEWDNWYVENFSLWLDLKIVLLTARALCDGFCDVE